MSLNSWWQRLFTNPRQTPLRRRKLRGRRLMTVEVLENRLVPAQIFVTSFADDSTPDALVPLGGGKFNATSLRSAVLHSDDFAGPNTIFLATTAGTPYDINFGEMEVNYTKQANLRIVNKTTSGISEIDGNESSRIFHNHDGGTLTLERLKLTNGLGQDDGYGNDYEAHGGAIINESKLVLNCTQFVENVASGYGDGAWALGGAIYNDYDATLNVKKSTFDSNRAEGNDIQASGTFFSQDAGGAEGGAIYVSPSGAIAGTIAGGSAGDSAKVTITASTFSFNEAEGGYNAYGGGEGNNNAGDAFGGAIAMGNRYYSGIDDINEITVVNSTFYRNAAYGGNVTGGEGSPGSAFGGAINQFDDHHVVLVNDTIAYNFAGEGYGGYYNASAYGGGINNFGGEGNLESINTIIAQNEFQGDGDGPDISGGFTSLGNNLIGNTDGSFGSLAPTDITGVDPEFDLDGLQPNGAGPNVPLTLGIYAYSPAINAGNNAVTVAGSLATSLGINPLTTDERGNGFPRKVAKIVDIGAFEFQMNLDKIYYFKSLRNEYATFFIPAPGVLLGASSALPTLPSGEEYVVTLYGSPPGFGTTLVLNSNGSFTFKVPPKFNKTTSFQFQVLVTDGISTRTTSLYFTATLVVTPPAGGRGSAGNFLGLGGGGGNTGGNTGGGGGGGEGGEGGAP